MHIKKNDKIFIAEIKNLFFDIVKSFPVLTVQLFLMFFDFLLITVFEGNSNLKCFPFSKSKHKTAIQKNRKKLKIKIKKYVQTNCCEQEFSEHTGVS